MTLGFPNQGFLNLVETQREKIEMHSKEKTNLRETMDEIRLSKYTFSVQALRKGGPLEAMREMVEE